MRNIRRARFTLEQNQAISQAFRLHANGKSGEAAVIFARLAQQMETSHAPRRAANLHAQAAHAYIDNQEAAPGLSEAQKALNLFLQTQMTPRAVQFYTNITQKLQNRGMNSASQKLQDEFGSQIGSIPTRQSPPVAPSTGRLPTTCPQCGGPIHRDAVDWVDNRTIECAYCGALIQSN